MNATSIIVAVVSVLFAGGLAAGVAVLLKIRPEAGQFTVTAAQGVVLMQSQQLEAMEGRLDRALAEIDELRGHITEMSALRQKVRALEQELEIKTAENESLRNRVKALEEQVATLERKGTP